MTKPHSDFNDNHFMHVRKTNSVESSNFLLLIVTIYIFSLPTSEHITDMSKKRPIYDNAKFEVALVADMVACFLVLAAESPLLGRRAFDRNVLVCCFEISVVVLPSYFLLNVYEKNRATWSNTEIATDNAFIYKVWHVTMGIVGQQAWTVWTET